jgi:hypothetical protein
MPEKQNQDSFKLRIDAAVAELGRLDPDELACRGGLGRNGESLQLEFLGKAYILSLPDFVARTADGDVCPDSLRILFLDYLLQGDGSPPTGTWIGYQELPDGAFYRHAFQGYSGDQLVRDLDGSVEAFRRAAEAVDGEPFEMGDAGFRFRVLPNVPLAIVWWAGDDEFPASATVLFDEVAGRYLPADGLAILGRMLCRRLVKAAST